MAIELKETGDAGILEVFLTGKLVKEDYDTFVPAVDQAIKAHGKLQMLDTRLVQQQSAAPVL